MNRFFFCILLLVFTSIRGEAQFVEVTDQHNIHSVNTGNLYGNGVSFYDFNHDGWDDLSMASGALEPQFFVNNQGQFEPISFGVLNADGKQVHAIQWIDWDNDGDSDLFITRLNAFPKLMRNDGDLTFTDITAGSGINQGIYIYLGAAWTDYDKDGNLDFYLSKYYNPINYPGNDFISRLYKGNGDGTFIDVTQTSGVFLPPRPCFQPVWLDYNNDGWEDLYLIIDRNSWRNEMFKNNGDGTFTNVTDDTGTGVYIDAMTGTVGDYDNDLDLDIYVTNGYDGNKLFRNDADGTFAEIAEELGLEVGVICWGAQWIDYDNNSWQDLYVSATGAFYGPYQNQFFINDQNGGFYDGIEETGILGDISPSMATTMGDINNDGYYDYFNANNAPYEADLWQNLGGDNHWLGVEVEGTFSNRDGFGTTMKLHANGHSYLRCVHGGENFIGQNSGKEIFGLGETTFVDSLEVFWPLGLREVYYNIAVDQYLDLKEGDSENTPPTISLNQTSFCEVENVLLSSEDWTVISWNEGTINDSLWVNEPEVFEALVMDAKGHFFYTEPIVISEFILPEYTLVVNEILCHGDSNGGIGVQLINNAEVNFILWNDTDYFGNAISSLDPGVYTYTINYAQNCTLVAAVELTMPDSISIASVVTNASCFEMADGMASLEITGGTGDYTIHWNDSNPEALSAGQYTIEVTDANNCQAFHSFEIAQPDSMQVVFQSNDVSCFGGDNGIIEVLAISGGTPGYTIDWNQLDTAALSAGNFMFTVYDLLGCEDQMPFSIGQPAELMIEVVTTNEIENGPQGSIVLEIDGGIPPYDVYMDGILASSVIENLTSGQYDIEVTDANGCSVWSSVEIDFVNAILENSTPAPRVYPNPARDFLYIQHLTKPQGICVFDVTGKVVLQGKTSPSESLSVAGLSQGCYIIRFDDLTLDPVLFTKH
jgi:FG-GAP-like repeat/ASPIC and UnbV/SprB repeat/Secretion system C-terminal sorting domain